MAIYVDIHQILSVIKIIKTVVSTLNFKVNNSVFINDFKNFEC